MQEVDEYLDILGQQPGLKIYTQITSCFAVADASSHSAIVDTLTKGLEQTSTSFPWVAGQVINEGASEGNSGLFKVKPLDKIPRLFVKDLRDDPSAPTMEALRQANFPMGMLDESIVCPARTLPRPSDEHGVNPAPVFLLQATFISGGLLLSFVGQHSTMDMAGQGQIMRLVSKACKKEPFTKEELSSGNLPRRNLIPLLNKSDIQGHELDNQIIKSNSPDSVPTATDGLPPPTLPPKCIWANFAFSPASFAAVKSLATKTLDPGTDYISTDDALSAFTWQSIMRARLPRLGPQVSLTFTRAVDVRRYLNIPSTYPGLMQCLTYHTSSLSSLVSKPLGAIASDLRAAVAPKTNRLADNTRALATAFEQTPDKSVFSFTANLDLGKDVMLSSWAKFDYCSELDFGLGLGPPEAVRRPRFDPVESLIYLLPKARHGEIAVAMCLREEDMERLKGDEEWKRWARYVG